MPYMDGKGYIAVFAFLSFQAKFVIHNLVDALLACFIFCYPYGSIRYCWLFSILNLLDFGIDTEIRRCHIIDI